MNWPHVSCEVDKKGNIVFEVTSHKGDTDEVTRFIVYADLRKAHCHLPHLDFCWQYRCISLGYNTRIRNI